MKTIAFLCLLASASLAQTPDLRVDTTTGAVYYQQIVRLDSTLEAHLVLRHALSWLSTVYSQGDPVVERYDPAQGIMIVRAHFPLSVTGSGSRRSKRSVYTPRLVAHLLIIDTHRGQCQLSLTGFEPEVAQQLRSPDVAVTEPAYGGELKKQCVALLTSFQRQWGQ